MNELEKERALIRADVGRALGLAFDAPSAGMLTDLRGMLTGLLGVLEPRAHPLCASLKDLAATLPNIAPDILEHEYHQLFTTQMLATPYESSYHRTARGAVIGDVTAFYTAFGLQARPGQGAADSMRNELCFLAWLAYKEMYAMERGQTEAVETTRLATRAFLADHIGRWAPAFVERLMNATTSPFYVAAANLLIAALNECTAEFVVNNVTPVDAAGAGIEPDVMPCPAAGTCGV